MKAITLSIALIILTTTTIFSQSIGNYTASRTTGITYSSISSNGNSVATWRNTGQYSQDDNRSIPLDIGFDFWYNGVRYTQFNVSTNGYVDFSSSTANGTGTGAYGYSNTRFTNTSPTGIALAPMYDDMTAQGGDEALGNSIKYLTTGSAPNRILTIEWINMAVYNNTSPDLNFQVKLYETSGLIEFIYGTMTPGNVNYSYSLGINAGTISNPPTSSQLLMQQSSNSNTFSNSAANSLGTVPASNSKITFTPPNHSGTFNSSISFSSITASGMNVNYSNWCTNEIGYAIYMSTNNVDFDFVTQNAVNTTSYTASGLLPNTTYYWKVYAITEGKLSSAASGNQITSAAGTKTSNVTSGNWNTSGSWTPSGVPSATDNVIIKNGHTITINANAQCNNLTIGEGSSGTLRIGNSGTTRNLTVNGNLVVNTGATIIAGTSNATHNAVISGNITNNGTLNFRPTSSRVVNVTFDKDGNQTISGSGATTAFNNIIQNMGTNISNTLDISSTNFTAPDNFLTLTNGTFKLGSTNNLTINLYASDITFSTTNGFHLNNSNATINFNGDLVLNGALTVQSGTVNIGNDADEYIESKGGVVQVSGGNLNIASRYFSSDINTLTDFTMTGGVLTIPSIGSTNTNIYPFQIHATGSTFNMSGGSIIIPVEGGDGTQDLGMYIDGLAVNNISGGTIQFGNGSTPANQIFKLFSSGTLPNLLVHNSNSTVNLMSDIDCSGNLSINGGVLDANNNDISLSGNWTNTGSFIEGQNTVILNGSGTQVISTTGGENFYNLTLAKNSGSVNAGSDSLWIRGTLDVQSGTLTTNNKLVLRSDANGTARVAAINSGVISGNVIAQRFMPGGENKRKWRYMSSPVNVGGSISLTQFIDDIYVSGEGGSNNGFDDSPNNNHSIRSYNESLDGGVDIGWVGPASINTTYTTGSGFEVFGRGSRSTQNPFDVNTIPLDATIDLIGTINQGNITTNLSFTDHDISTADGFNLIGNPYPSAIDFNSANVTKTNMLNTFWVYNPNTGSYGVYDGNLNVGTNGISRYISSGQGFFVKATSANASISYTENCKTANVPFTYFRGATSNSNGNILSMKVVLDSITSDELLIAFRENANKTDVDQSDARKFFSDQLNFYSKSSNGTNLAINEYPVPTESDTISLSFFSYDELSIPIEGSYTINSKFDQINTNISILLFDTYNGETINLKKIKSYSFDVTSDPLTFGNNRFKLILNGQLTAVNKTISNNNFVLLYPNPVESKLFVRFSNLLRDKSCKVSLFNQAGKLLHEEEYEINNSELSIPVEELESGVYIIVLDKESGEIREKFTKE